MAESKINNISFAPNYSTGRAYNPGSTVTVDKDSFLIGVANVYSSGQIKVFVDNAQAVSCFNQVGGASVYIPFFIPIIRGSTITSIVYSPGSFTAYLYDAV